MKRGVCALCRKEADLLDSHLLPSAIYKLMRMPELKNPNPVYVKRGVAVATSAEARMHFLCAQCEDRINIGGEKWTVTNCLQRDGSFPLLESLERTGPAESGQGYALYRGSDVEGVEPNRLAFFAVSVIWKCAFSMWKNKNGSPLDLGPYKEGLRAYLLGECVFPLDAALQVLVARPPKTFMGACLPTPDRWEGIQSYSFVIPGIIFTLGLGRHIPDHVRTLACFPSPERFLMRSEELWWRWLRAAQPIIHGAVRKGSFAKTNSS